MQLLHQLTGSRTFTITGIYRIPPTHVWMEPFHLSQYSVLCIMHSVFCIVYSVQIILYSVICILYYVFCNLYSVFCVDGTFSFVFQESQLGRSANRRGNKMAKTICQTLYNVYCILYTVQFILYIVHCLL